MRLDQFELIRCTKLYCGLRTLPRRYTYLLTPSSSRCWNARWNQIASSPPIFPIFLCIRDSIYRAPCSRPLAELTKFPVSISLLSFTRARDCYKGQTWHQLYFQDSTAFNGRVSREFRLLENFHSLLRQSVVVLCRRFFENLSYPACINASNERIRRKFRMFE